MAMLCCVAQKAASAAHLGTLLKITVPLLLPLGVKKIAPIFKY